MVCTDNTDGKRRSMIGGCRFFRGKKTKKGGFFSSHHARHLYTGGGQLEDPRTAVAQTVVDMSVTVEGARPTHPKHQSYSQGVRTRFNWALCALGGHGSLRKNRVDLLS